MFPPQGWQQPATWTRSRRPRHTRSIPVQLPHPRRRSSEPASNTASNPLHTTTTQDAMSVRNRSRYMRPGTVANANAATTMTSGFRHGELRRLVTRPSVIAPSKKATYVHLRECSDRYQRRDDHCGRDAQAAARDKPPHRDCDSAHHSNEAQLLRVSGLEGQLRQVKKGDRRPDRGEQQAPGEQPYWNARKRRAPEPDDDGYDSRRIVRHRDADDPVKDLLPQVVGRSVLRVDVVVERKALQELLNRYEEISLVVVPLELCEDEAMADPREYAQETRRRKPDTRLLRGDRRGCRKGFDRCARAHSVPSLHDFLPLFGKLQAIIHYDAAC